MVMRYFAIAMCALVVSLAAQAGEEKIRGVLEKTVKLDACAQMTDALNEMYYVAKTDAAEKMVAEYVGKNQKVVLIGTIESKPNESVPFINLKSVELYTPKLPPAPLPPAPPVTEKKEEKKDEKKPDEKKEEKKEDAKK